MEKQCSIRKKDNASCYLNKCRKIYTILFLNKQSILEEDTDTDGADNCLHGKNQKSNDQKTVGSFVRHVRARQDSRKGQSVTCGVN